MPKAIRVVLIWLGLAIFLWFGITAMYGAGHTPVESSPMYNSSEQGIHTAFVRIPIISAIVATLLLIWWYIQYRLKPSHNTTWWRLMNNIIDTVRKILD